jgi:hypothetical protein
MAHVWLAPAEIFLSVEDDVIEAAVDRQNAPRL